MFCKERQPAPAPLGKLVNCTDTRWVRSDLAQVQLQRERRPRRASERQVACAQLHSDGWGCWGAARPGCLEALHMWVFSKVKIPCLMVPSGRVRIIGHLNEGFGCLWVRLVLVPCLFQGVRSCPCETRRLKKPFERKIYRLFRERSVNASALSSCG